MLVSFICICMKAATGNILIYIYRGSSDKLEKYSDFFINSFSELVSDILIITDKPGLKVDVAGKFNNLKILLFPLGSNVFRTLWDVFKDNKLQLFNYDGIIISTNFCYGPVLIDWKTFFKKIESRKLDYWSFFPFNSECKDKEESREIINPVFIYFSRNVIKDESFRIFWNKFPEGPCDNDAVVFRSLIKQLRNQNHEYLFNYEDLRRRSDCYQRDYSLELIKRGCPVVLRDAFLGGYQESFKNGNGLSTFETFAYLKKNNFPVNVIEDDLLVNLPISQIKKILHLNYFLKDYCQENFDRSSISAKTALIFFVYYEDLVQVCCSYIQNMPSESKVFIVSAKEELLQRYREFLSSCTKFKVEYRLQPNRGRSEAAYFTTCADVWEKYDFLCLAHDKKTSFISPPIKGESFMAHCLKNILGSEGLVLNVQQLFRENPKLGILEPPPPVFSAWDSIATNPWGQNEKEAQKTLAFIGGQFIWDEKPIGPIGGMFWVRSKALTRLLARRLKVEDYPPEPLAHDGTFLHSLERLYPTIAQSNGFLTGWGISEEYARVYLDNMYHKLEQNGDFVSVMDIVRIKVSNGLSGYPLIHKLVKKVYSILKNKCG